MPPKGSLRTDPAVAAQRADYGVGKCLNEDQGLKGYSGDFFMVPDLLEILLNSPNNIAKIVSQILGQNNFFHEVIEFTILVLTVFFKLKVSTGNNEKVTSVEGRGSLFGL